jgi:hypothetical protein
MAKNLTEEKGKRGEKIEEKEKVMEKVIRFLSLKEAYRTTKGMIEQLENEIRDYTEKHFTDLTLKGYKRWFFKIVEVILEPTPRYEGDKDLLTEKVGLEAVVRILEMPSRDKMLNLAKDDVVNLSEKDIKGIYSNVSYGKLKVKARFVSGEPEKELEKREE